MKSETLTLKKEVEALCLRDCGFGLGGHVVTLPIADAAMGASQGMLDLHPDAIKFAKQNRS